MMALRSVQQLPPIVPGLTSVMTPPAPPSHAPWTRGQIGRKQLLRLSVTPRLTGCNPHSIICLLAHSHKTVLQVLVPSAGIRGFLDASEFGTWLKFVRTKREKHNMKHVLLGGQIFYETVIIPYPAS